MADTMSTPNLDRLREVKNESEIISPFLDWMRQRFTMYDNTIARSDDDRYMPVDGPGDYINPEKLLADYFGIDLQEMEKERAAILDSLRQTH